MKLSEAFPSKYLAKDDVEQPVTDTIAGVTFEYVKGENGDEQKAVMSFSNHLKPLILNRINWMVCEDAYGPDSDAWLGKPIQAYKDASVMFGAKRVGGVRLRLPAHAPAPKPAAVYTLEQAKAALALAECSLDDFKAALPKNEKGNATYVPERDSHLVDELISFHKATAAEIAF